MSRERIPMAAVLCGLVATVLLGSCDEAEVSDESLDLDDDDAPYPYALVIGGGLSETLSALEVAGPGDRTLHNDVRVTGSGINQLLLRSGELYALCSLSNSVVVYDSSSLELSREISVGAGSNPMILDFDQDGLAWIADFISEDVSIYDLSAGLDPDEREIARIEMPDDLGLPEDPGETVRPRPNGLVVRGDRVFVSLGNLNNDFVAGGPGALVVIDRPSRTIERVIGLEGRDTTGLLDDNGRGLLWATSAGDFEEDQGFIGNGMVEAVDPETLEIVRSFDVDAAPMEMVLDASGNGWLGNGKEGVLLSIDLETGAELREIDLRPGDDEFGLSFLSGLVLAPDGLVYASEFNHDKLFAIDPETGEVRMEVVVNDGPDALAIIP